MSNRRGDFNNNKPKRAGSLYINGPYECSNTLKDKIKKMIKFMGENKISFSLSCLQENGEYKSYSGFHNNFRNNAKDADFILYERKPSGNTQPKKSVSNEIEDDFDDIDF